LKKTQKRTQEQGNGPLEGLESSEYRSWKEKEVKRIEALTCQEIEWMLKGCGFKRGSGNWNDYVRAQRFVIRGLYIKPQIYDNHNRTIQKYLNV
jgi:hypothetical protein